MSNSAGGLAYVVISIGAFVCEIHGLYLAYQESFVSFVIAFFIPPWAIIKGLIGFF